MVKRKNLLKPLTKISNLISGKPSILILNNILLKIKKNNLLLTSTNLEVELTTSVSINNIDKCGEITVPAIKFFNICRSLPEDASILIHVKKNKILIISGVSKFIISTLPAENFPRIDNWKSKVDLILKQQTLKQIIELTKFSMAYRDFRYYLNGMLFEITKQKLCIVTTDGYRLSIYTMNLKDKITSITAILPRKSVKVLLKIINNNQQQIKLQIGTNNIKAITDNIIFTSKLIDGKFPNYNLVYPKNPSKIIEVSVEMLKQALIRVSIITNETFRGVRLNFTKNLLKITADNYEQEKAEEILNIIYPYEDIEISLNVNYLLDILNTLKCSTIIMLITDIISSVIIKNNTYKSLNYILMPLRL